MKRSLLAVALAAGIALGAEGDLLDAIRSGSELEVKKALEAGHSVNGKDAKGTPALMYAAVYGPASMMRMLIDAGADVNAANEAGATPLMAAIADLEKVKLLVEKGAAVESRSAAGSTPMELAGRLPHGASIVRYLLSKGAKPETAVLRNALRRVDLALVRELMAAGGQLDGSNATLAAAAVSGSVEAMRMALAAVGPGNVPPAGDGQSSARPLMLAAFYGPAESVRLLIEKGAALNDKDSRGRTALMYAVSGVHPDAAVARTLREAGVDETVKDVRGDTYKEWARYRTGVVVADTPITGTAALPPLRESLQRGLSLLDAAGPAFFKANGCISCHNQSIPQMAYDRLRQSGVGVSDEGAHNHTKAVLSVWGSASSNLWQTNCSSIGGQVATMSYGLMGLRAADQPRTAAIDLVTHCLMALQELGGSWNLADQRAPLGIGREKFTALSIGGLQRYALPGRKAETEERIARGRRYLETARHDDTQGLAFRILGLRWAGGGGDARLIARLSDELARLQRSGGGWGQRPELPPDAFATGQALWALTEGGQMKVTDRVYRRGAAYLRRAQRPDGSWYVHSRGFGFQPYRETGFPHGHDQWLSAAATGFALLGLAPMAAPLEQRAGGSGGAR